MCSQVPVCSADVRRGLGLKTEGPTRTEMKESCWEEGLGAQNRVEVPKVCHCKQGCK